MPEYVTEYVIETFEPRWPRASWWQKFYLGPGGCWLWTGLKVDGYGTTEVNGENMTHRATYRLFVGPIPHGYEIDHLCKVRACANPSHLEAVTPEENRRRSPRWPDKASV